MAPPLKKEQQELLHSLYYDKNLKLGRDKLFHYIYTKFPESEISRRQVMDFLNSQESHQVFQQKKKQTSSMPIISNAPRNVFQIDLIDFTTIPDNGFNYILNVIDVFSRKLWLFPIKNKTPASIKSILSKLFETDKPKFVQTDQGNEFNGLEILGIKHNTSKAYTPQQQAIVERSNGVIKTMIKKCFYENGNERWLGILRQVEDNYNETINRNTKKTPNELYKTQNIEEEAQKQKENKQTLNQQVKEIDKGQTVRILIENKKSKMQQNYSQEIYKVSRVVKPKELYATTRYVLIDSQGKTVKGLYNISKLLAVEIPNSVSEERDNFVKLPRSETKDINIKNIISTKRERKVVTYKE